MYRRKSLILKIYKKIKKSKDIAFLQSEFYLLNSDPDQVLRALRRLTQDKILIRIGKGIYAKAKTSPVTKKCVPESGLISAGRQALQKLGIKIFPASAERLYNQGLSSQVPTGRVVGVKCRISRNISFNGVKLSYERV